MHELSVALRIREVLEVELASEGEDVVAESVRIRVGALSGIVPEALQFAWPHAVAGSAILESAVIEIDRVDVTLTCRECSATHTAPTLTTLRCPVCRSGQVDVAGGDELDIVSVDVRDATPQAS